MAPRLAKVGGTIETVVEVIRFVPPKKFESAVGEVPQSTSYPCSRTPPVEVGGSQDNCAAEVEVPTCRFWTALGVPTGVATTIDGVLAL